MDDHRLNELLQQVLKEPVTPPPDLVAATCRRVRGGASDRSIVMLALIAGAVSQAVVWLLLVLHGCSPARCLLLMEFMLLLTNGVAVVLLLAWRPVSSFFYRLGIELEPDNPTYGRIR